VRSYESLSVWTNDPDIGGAAAKILSIAEKLGNPETPMSVRPEEFDIPFDYRYDAEDELQTQLLRRVAVLFAAVDVHCYWRDRRQVVGVMNNPAGEIEKAWSKFHEQALDVVINVVTKMDLG
jgi:hypothetical protein